MGRSIVKSRTYGEQPLQCQRHSPSPLVASTVVGVGRTSDDYASDRPRHLQGGRHGTSKGKRYDLTGVGGGVCDEDSPRNTFECLSDGENGEGVCLYGLC